MRGTWDDLNRRLAGAILALDLDDSLVVGDRVDRGRRSLLGRRAPVPARRYVQVTAAQSVLLAECVGSRSFGGAWEMDPDTEAALERRGWERPWSPDYPTYQREAPLVRAPHLARACVRALQTLGCEMEDLVVELVRDEQA